MTPAELDRIADYLEAVHEALSRGHLDRGSMSSPRLSFRIEAKRLAALCRKALENDEVLA